jgi:hypothetical protein
MVVEDGTRCRWETDCVHPTPESVVCYPVERCWAEWHCNLPAEAPR